MIILIIILFFIIAGVVGFLIKDIKDLQDSLKEEKVAENLQCFTEFLQCGRMKRAVKCIHGQMKKTE